MKRDPIFFRWPQMDQTFDTFGPNSDKGAMGYQSLVHLWPFKKKIGSLFIRFNDFQAFPIFFQNRAKLKFPSLMRELILSWTRDFQEVINSAPGGLET